MVGFLYESGGETPINLVVFDKDGTLVSLLACANAPRLQRRLTVCFPYPAARL